MKNLLTTFCLSMTLFSCSEHLQYTSIKEVLEKKKVGKEYRSLTDTVAETKVVYLGEFKKKDGQLIKVVNSVSLVGEFERSKKASCKIAFYDSSGNFIGSYYVGATWDLPSKLEDGALIFGPSSYCKTVDRINLMDSIPQKLYVKCNGNSGDLYEFSTDPEN